MPSIEARCAARTRRFDDVVNRLTVVLPAEVAPASTRR